MLRVRFSEKSKQLIVNKHFEKNYFELIDTQAIDIFLSNKYQYVIVDENEPADICIIGIQHNDNSLLRENEYNIFLSVENFSVGRTHYNHWNKFGRFSNSFIDKYIYNDISHPENNIIPAIYCRVKYFNSIYDNFENIRNAIPYENKKFCLFISKNRLNSNKLLAVRHLSKIKKVDFITQYDLFLKNKTCYNSPEIISVFSQYKFIICFENSKTPGYITEKIFNVFLAGSIPIYDGAPNITDYINIEAFIPFDNLFLNKIQLLLNNKELYNSIVSKKKTNDLDYTCIDEMTFTK